LPRPHGAFSMTSRSLLIPFILKQTLNFANLEQG
jgi:hypothetical protein